MPLWLPEYLYTTVLKPAPLRCATNWLLLRMVPQTARVGDVQVALNPADPVVSGAITLGVYEKLETQFLRRRLGPGMTVVDIGANVGYYTAMFAHAIGPDGRVIAFEPEPDNLHFLSRTIELNGFQNVDIVPAALSDHPGQCRLYLSDDNRGDHRIYNGHQGKHGRRAIDVTMTTLDDALEQRGALANVTLIKMDIQGAEALAIGGMTRTLAANSELCMLTEFWPQGMRNAGGDPVVFLQTLKDAGMTIHRLVDGPDPLQPVDDFARLIDALPGRHYTNLVCSRKELSP